MKQIGFAGKSAAEIMKSVEQAIAGGRLAAGTLLPTVRELAAMLGVSAATAAGAYRQLQARGVLIAEGRRGTRVRGGPHLHASHTAPPAILRPGVIDLATGNPDPALLPPLEDALRSLERQHSLYDDPPELKALTAFARAEFAADDVVTDSIVVTSGALDAIERILREHVRPGDRVIVEDPVVPAIGDLLAACGYVADSVAVDAEGIRPDSLDAALRRRGRAVILTPRAQNPTGAAVTRVRATDLRTCLRSFADVLVIENDPFAPIAGVPMMTLTPGRAHWAVVRSCSKFLGPDLRVAVVAGDGLTLARVRGRQAIGPRRVSRLLQQLVVSLWSDPSSGRRLARATDTYALRRRTLVQALADHHIAVTSRSGFNVWVPVRHETEVTHRLAERGWAVAGGERFRRHAGPGIRITTSALEPADATRLAADLAASTQEGSPQRA